MNTKDIGGGLVRLTPSTIGNKILDVYSGDKYSEVECKAELAARFQEAE